MSAFTVEQQTVIEAVAAQLYDRDETSLKAQVFWPMVDAQVQKRYRMMAQRKLRTGEIDGWFKLQEGAKLKTTGRPTKEIYRRSLVLAAE